MKFSQRIGITPIRETMQIDSIDHELSNKLWNLIYQRVIEPLDDYEMEETRKIVMKHIWTGYFGEKVDETPNYNGDFGFGPSFRTVFKERYFRLHWFQVYEFLEFLCEMENDLIIDDFASKCNVILREKMSAYRIIEGKVVRITSEEEIEAIETTLLNSTTVSSVNKHIKAALAFLSDREMPNYRNSIKESISAVEAMCSRVTGVEKDSLDNALKKIESKYNIHKALRRAFTALYGYSSNAGGIRHALAEDDIDVTFEDAKFMLVICSAFINYLQEKTTK